MIEWKKYTVLLASLITISGCTAMGKSDFSCSGPTPGVSCLPAAEVYDITNDPELYEAVNAALTAAAQSDEEYDAREIVAYVRANHKPSIEVTKPMAEPVKAPLPVLMPAQVIRIWIAPWPDQKGDLHFPGYIFTEITPRRWSLGEPALSGAQVLAPVQVDRSRENDGSATNTN